MALPRASSSSPSSAFHLMPGTFLRSVTSILLDSALTEEAATSTSRASGSTSNTASDPVGSRIVRDS
jgi:hypothetical protein